MTEAQAVAGDRKRLDSAAYMRFESRLRGVWHASLAAGIDEPTIERAAACSPADAWRVALVRRVASPVLVALWLRGELTIRQLIRICIDAPLLDPHQEPEQLELAARYSRSAKRTLDEA